MLTQTKCVGSGVPGHVYEFGHTIVPGTEHMMFRVSRRRSASSRYEYLRRRCRVCDSARNEFERESCDKKWTDTFREHTGKMVKKGHAPNRSVAKDLMLSSGLTKVWGPQMFRNAIGQLCPGMCGWPERHRITRYADLELDWRDPRFPITPENCGPLCGVCNREKQDTPWAEFMARQHAIRMNLERAVAFPPPAVQLSFDLDGLV